jgi:hypothetical protein
MEKTTIVEHTEQDGTITEHIVIDNGNGSFTSMLKSTYDAMQAKQSTPIVIDEAETK